jgi:hypothetical protein
MEEILPHKENSYEIRHSSILLSHGDSVLATEILKIYISYCYRDVRML